MSLKDIFLEEYEEIKEKSELRSEQVKYLIKLYKENYSKLETRYKKEIQNCENPEGVLYSKLKGLVKELIDLKTGLSIVTKGKNDNLPEIYLGWLKLNYNDNENRTNPEFTEKGKEIYSVMKSYFYR